IMVVVLSVFSGFQEEVHSSLWNSGYHITVTNQDPSIPIANYSELLRDVQGDPKIAPFLRSGFGSISANTLLEVQSRFEGKALRALPVDPDFSRREERSRAACRSYRKSL
ncbi:MAG: hypothetical protein HY042_05765, partial [Spirochaetia bacterium]|nr:hypothetical protein [Spirochaetia bacterium]